MRWYLGSWWIFAPWTLLLIALHVWSHTIGRYWTGKTPALFGMDFGHGDEPFLMVSGILLLGSAVWLATAVILGAGHFVLRRRVPDVVAWRGFALSTAFCLFLIPAEAWDQMLLHTIGPGKAGGNLLGHAARSGELARLRQLLAAGIAADAHNYGQQTWRGHTAFAEETALVASIKAGQYGSVVILLDHGADPNLRDSGDNTPLMHAVRTRDAKMVRLLLDRRADRCATAVMKIGSISETFSAQKIAQRMDEPEILKMFSACPPVTDSPQR